jgi:hypothetical protein
MSIQLVVAGEGGGPLLVDFTGAFTPRALTPGRVARLVRHALRQGWRPELPGPPIRLERQAAQLPARPFPVKEHPDTPGRDLAWAVDLDPLHRAFPWPHRREVFSAFRLDGACTPADLGTLLGSLIAYRSGEDPPLDLQRLDWDRLAARNLSVSAGVCLYVGGERRMAVGCCASLNAGREWRDLPETGQAPWNGHDPFSTATLDREAGLVHFHDPAHAGDARPAVDSVALPVYRALIRQLEADLHAFLEAWAAFLRPLARDRTELFLSRFTADNRLG